MFFYFFKIDFIYIYYLLIIYKFVSKGGEYMFKSIREEETEFCWSKFRHDKEQVAKKVRGLLPERFRASDVKKLLMELDSPVSCSGWKIYAFSDRLARFIKSYVKAEPAEATRQGIPTVYKLV